MSYWVLERFRSDADAYGVFRRQRKCAGPFATSQHAWAAQRDLVDRLSEHARMTGNPNYFVLSDDQIEEGRRQGIDFS
jgi:hypothetical protein